MLDPCLYDCYPNVMMFDKFLVICFLLLVAQPASQIVGFGSRFQVPGIDLIRPAHPRCDTHPTTPGKQPRVVGPWIPRYKWGYLGPPISGVINLLM